MIRHIIGGRTRSASLARTEVRLVAVQRTPGSLLETEVAAEESPYFIGKRARLATCGGAAWFHDLHIATLNLLGNSVHTYRFDARGRTLAPLEPTVSLQDLHKPENLAFSPDGALLAVTNSVGTVNIYRVDVRDHSIDPTPVMVIDCGPGTGPHGVCFSPDASMLCFSTVEDKGSLRLFQIARSSVDSIALMPVQALENRFAPLKPKGVAFSPNMRFLVVAYGVNAKEHPHRGRASFIAAHAFSTEGIVGSDPVQLCGRRLGVRCAEDVNFFPDGSHLLVTDQEADAAVVVNFESRTGAIGDKKSVIENPWAQLSFPHGNSISADGRFVAIANYGDDRLTIFEVTRGIESTGGSKSSSVTGEV
jgi:6-phosphogluconolactonase (cycloisomerase 2 family)